MRPLEASQTAVEQIEHSILWQGYGNDIGRIYQDERVQKVLNGGQQTFDVTGDQGE